MPFYYAVTLLFSLFVLFHPFEAYSGKYYESFKLNIKINKTDKKILKILNWNIQPLYVQSSQILMKERTLALN